MFVTRELAPRRPQRVASLPWATPLVVAPYAAWISPARALHYDHTQRWLQSVPSVYTDAADPPLILTSGGQGRTDESFITAYQRGRQHLRVIDSPWAGLTAKPTSPAVLIARPEVNRRRTNKRYDEFFIPTTILAPTAQSTERFPAYVAPKQFRREGWRKRLETLELNSYPLKPPVPEQPLTSWIPPKAHTRDRTVYQQRLFLLEFPQTPPRAEQPLPAWIPPALHRVERNAQRLDLELNVYPRTPDILTSYWRPETIKAKGLSRRLLLAAIDALHSVEPAEQPPEQTGPQENRYRRVSR